MPSTEVPQPSKPKPPKKIKIKNKSSVPVAAVAPVAANSAVPSTSSDGCSTFQSSGNIFQDSLSNASCVEEQLMGPTYPYWNNIRSPSELGMSDKGSISVMAKDVAGLINYVELLVTGSGKASKTGKPLGNKFFLKTGAKCTDDQNNSQDRYIYINNVPLGNIPFISSGMGTNFKDMRGLLPGTMSNLNSLNPFEIIQGFSAGGSPSCQQITLQTIDNNNVVSTETHYMTKLDLQSMDPCNFSDSTNPITGAKCKNAFGNMSDYCSNEYYNDNDYLVPDDELNKEDEKNNDDESKERLSLPNDPIIQIYLACLGILGIYVLYKIMVKK